MRIYDKAIEIINILMIHENCWISSFTNFDANFNFNDI